METRIKLAKQKGLSRTKISRCLTVVSSFFTHNRAPLVEVTFAYKPKPHPPLDEKQPRKFRDKGFNQYGKVLFDFLLSVSIRVGQFRRCRNCGEEFYPRWRDIMTFPKIETYSPFMIKTEKGHESERYPNGLSQVCFLTKSAAEGLNWLRQFKEEELGRKIRKDEYIFTYQQDHIGKAHIAPTTIHAVQAIFRDAEDQTGVHATPNILRSWTNTILATRGAQPDSFSK